MNRQFFLGIEPGTLLFKKFVCERCLFASDLSAVYLCRDIMGNRAVALKVVSTQEFEQSATGQRLYNELEVSRRVSHPNIVEYFDFHLDPDFAACAMEYLPGGSLASLLRGWGRLSAQDCFFVLEQLCCGVSAIHNAGVIHRDLKPANILFGTNGQVKIADFGIAEIGEKIVCGKEEVMRGTVNYLSPEYIQTGVFDRRCDIYALGLIGYQMLSGTLPVSGTNPIERMMYRVKSDPEPLHSLVNDCPLVVSEYIMKCITRDPNKRFQSPEEMLSGMKPILEFLNSEDQHQRSDEPTPHYQSGRVDPQFSTLH